MSIKRVTTELNALARRIRGINDWIEQNPHITDPNAYEIMDCNVSYAELISELKKVHTEKCGSLEPTVQILQTRQVLNESDPTIEKYETVPPTEPTIGLILTTLYPEAAEGLYELGRMDNLRSLETHPFFITPEAKAMYEQVKDCQVKASYIVSEDEGEKRIKRELLCKSMSVPFYIWQVKRTEPDYQYDNMTEFESMKQMNALYQATESPAQFTKAINNLHKVIDSSYKYSDSTTKNAGQK